MVQSHHRLHQPALEVLGALLVQLHLGCLDFLDFLGAQLLRLLQVSLEVPEVQLGPVILEGLYYQLHLENLAVLEVL
jgi:hypothetical protein